MNINEEDKIKNLFSKSNSEIKNKWSGSELCWQKITNSSKRESRFNIKKISYASSFLAIVFVLLIAVFNTNRDGHNTIFNKSNQNNISFSYEDYNALYNVDDLDEEIDFLVFSSDDITENNETTDLLEEIVQAI